MSTTPTRPDDLQPGDTVTWTPADGGTAKVAHVTLPTDVHASADSRVVEFEGGHSVRCHATDQFTKHDNA